MYPFHAWRHEHNTHHAHTNNLELDVDWRPVSEDVYRRMPLPVPVRLLQHALVGDLGRHHQLLGQIGFPAFVLSQEERCSVTCAAPSVFVAVVGGAYLGALTYFTGWQGLLLYFVAPWFAIHAWFSITTLMQHSAEDIPYLPDRYWTRNASRAAGHHRLRLPAVVVVLHALHLAAHCPPRRSLGALLQPAEGADRTETAVPGHGPRREGQHRPTLEHRAQMPFLRPDLGPLRDAAHVQVRLGIGPDAVVVHGSDSANNRRRGMRTGTLLAAATARGHRVVPRLAGRVHTAMFVNTRGLGRSWSDMCPLGARRIEMTGVRRVAAAYQWGRSGAQRARTTRLGHRQHHDVGRSRTLRWLRVNR